MKAFLINSCITAGISLLVVVAFYLWFPVSIFDGRTFGSTITTIAAGDTLSASRAVINTNFSNLNTDKFELSDWYATTSANQLVDIGNQTSFSITHASTTNLDVASYLKVGTNGSSFVEIKATTCDLIGTDVSHTASTTVPYDCAITGVASGDVVFAQLATSTPAIASSKSYWDIIGAKASSTAGYITVLLLNNGATAIPSATSVGSSTNAFYADI